MPVRIDADERAGVDYIRAVTPDPISNGGAALRARIAVFSFVSLAGIGATFPFLAVDLGRRGLGPGEAGLLLALIPLGRLVATPAFGWIADRWGASALLIRAGCWISAASFTAVLAGARGWALAGLMIVFSVSRSAVGPLVDAMVVESLRAESEDATRRYGDVRRWGSLGFLVAVAGTGWLRERFPGATIGLGVALLFVGALLTHGLPVERSHGPAPIGPALRALARRPFLVPFLVACALHTATMSAYDMFLAVHVESMGLASGVVGAAIALGVGIEIGILSAASPLLGRVGPAPLAVAGCLLAVPRWLLTAAAPDATSLVAVQALHGVTFGFFWIAGVQLMAERAPSRVSASAQSLFMAATYGVGTLVAMAAGGHMVEVAGTTGLFRAMAAISALAAVSAALAAGIDRFGARDAAPTTG